MQRACAAAWLSGGHTRLLHPGHAADDKAALAIIAQLGATVQAAANEVIIDSKGITHSGPLSLDCGESGLSIRLFTPLAALSSYPVSLTGQGTLIHRPMDFFDTVLPSLGVKVRSNNGKLPIQVQGPLVPRTITVDGSISSQFLTGLLFAFAAAQAQGVTIKVEHPVSTPYTELTLSVMKAFGCPVPHHRNYQEYFFETGSREWPSLHARRDFFVEADWSSASFLLVAGALAGPLCVKGLDLQSLQADRAMLEALMAAGVSVVADAKGLHVSPATPRAFEFDATHCPDLFPPLVALAAYATGTTRIKGVHRLYHKESDRAAALAAEFGKMGLVITEEQDCLLVRGTGSLQGGMVHAHGDHRIAMALAVAGLRADKHSTISGAECVKKSYPDFFADLSMLGASLSLPDLTEETTDHP